MCMYSITSFVRFYEHFKNYTCSKHAILVVYDMCQYGTKLLSLCFSVGKRTGVIVDEAEPLFNSSVP